MRLLEVSFAVSWHKDALTSRAYMQVVTDTRVQVKPNVNNTASRIRDITRKNPPTFYGLTLRRTHKDSLMKCSRFLNL